jgi:hypothetical protein
MSSGSKVVLYLLSLNKQTIDVLNIIYPSQKLKGANHCCLKIRCKESG